MTFQTPPRTSELLSAIAAAHADRSVSVAEIMHALRGRAFGMAFLIFALPNCLPMLPGISVIAGLVIILIAAQLVIGRLEPWLPRRLAAREIDGATLSRLFTRAAPWIARLERVARPRASLLVGLAAQRFVGLLVLWMALLMMAPVPFIGNIPPAIAIVILSVGLIERDGYFVIAGLFAAAIATFLIGGAVFGVIEAVQRWVI